jgi:hypothetical protein
MKRSGDRAIGKSVDRNDNLTAETRKRGEEQQQNLTTEARRHGEGSDESAISVPPCLRGELSLI